MNESSNQDVIQSSPGSGECVRVQTNRTISIPSPDSDREMAIRCADWKMLERRLTAAASDPPKDYSTLYGILFGLSGSAWLSLIPLTIIKELPTWILPSYIAFGSACLFCGIFVFIFNRDKRKIRKTMIAALLDDINEIGSRFTPGSAQDEKINDPPSPSQAELGNVLEPPS